MTTRTPKLSLLYTHSAPIRWLRAAADVVDASLANLCAQQWQRVQYVPVESEYAQQRRRLR